MIDQTGVIFALVAVWDCKRVQVYLSDIPNRGYPCFGDSDGIVTEVQVCWCDISNKTWVNPCFGVSGGIVTEVQVCLSDRPNMGHLCFGGSGGIVIQRYRFD